MLRPAERDTERNLRLFSFVARHAARQRDKLDFEQYRPYVQMMHTRARATQALKKGEHRAALKRIDEGIKAIRKFLAEYQQQEKEEDCSELRFLVRWRCRKLSANVRLERLNGWRNNPELSRRAGKTAYVARTAANQIRAVARFDTRTQLTAHAAVSIRRQPRSGLRNDGQLRLIRSHLFECRLTVVKGYIVRPQLDAASAMFDTR